MAHELASSVASSPPPAPAPPQPAAPAASWWRDDMHPSYYSTSSWPLRPSAAPLSPQQQRRTSTSSGADDDMHPSFYSTSWPPRPSAAPAAAPLLWHHHQQQQRGTSTCSDDDFSASNAAMTSFTNTSTTTNHSAAAAAESHLWNQVLMGGAAGGEVMQHDDGENFLELLNSRTLAPELFAEPPPAPCNYLNKIEYGGAAAWTEDHRQFTAAALHKHHHLDTAAAAAAPPERLTAPDLVSNWSIAPPSHAVDGHRDNAAVTADHGALFLHDSAGGSNGKHSAGGSHHDFLRRPIDLGSYNSGMLGRLSNRMYGGGDAMDVQWPGTTNAAVDSRNTLSTSDLISFGGATTGKPAAALSASPPVKTSSSTGEYYTKQRAHETSSPAAPAKKTNSGGVNGGAAAKKRSEESGSEGNAKKSKHENSSPTSSLQTQVPKVKLGEKITALQQIVSPFGKTDTASVLYEAINYIKWLHEQVQLLSDPYMKSSSSKDYNGWGGGLHRKDKQGDGEAEADLRSRGLCLVPVSCTPEVYRDNNNGPDYWTPPYRSCLYR